MNSNPHYGEKMGKIWALALRTPSAIVMPDLGRGPAVKSFQPRKAG
jgi:hypothetical protein